MEPMKNPGNRHCRNQPSRHVCQPFGGLGKDQRKSKGFTNHRKPNGNEHEEYERPDNSS